MKKFIRHYGERRMMSSNKKSIELEKAIENKTARIAILGLGYVGLPLALAFAKKGFLTIGIDPDKTRINEIKRGKSYVNDIADSEIKAQVNSKKLLPSVSFEKIKFADAIIVCVPTPLNKTKDPDFSFVLDATDAIAPRLRRGQMVIIESTIYPGMTTELIGPRLEQKTGLKPGRDFFLAMSPERIDPGNKKYQLKNTPKVVGGINPKSTRLASMLYQQIIDRVIPVSSPTVAEMTKLLENTFRQINIGLVNEIAIICDKLGINVLEVIDAASTKPFGFMTFYPGPGTGGHCIPVDPIYLSWKMKSLNYRTRFIELATEINAQMPEFWVNKTQEQLNRKGKALCGARVLVIGVSYKKDINDLRESPALEILKLLLDKGAKVQYHDPYIPRLELEGKIIKSVKLSQSIVRNSDCVLIATDHSNINYQMLKSTAKLIIDTRGVYHRL